jgi:hypothetical protein
MKTNRFKLTTLACLASAVVFFSCSSCAVKSHFLTSKVVPAAQGIVQVSTDKNDNYVIKLEISNLSPSSRLTPPSLAYIVWLVGEDNSAKSLGQLNSSDNFMSKNLNATFEAVSASKPVKIVITAENDLNVQYPSFSEVILTTDVMNVKNR